MSELIKCANEVTPADLGKTITLSAGVSGILVGLRSDLSRLDEFLGVDPSDLPPVRLTIKTKNGDQEWYTGAEEAVKV